MIYIYIYTYIFIYIYVSYSTILYHIVLYSFLLHICIYRPKTPVNPPLSPPPSPPLPPPCPSLPPSPSLSLRLSHTHACMPLTRASPTARPRPSSSAWIKRGSPQFNFSCILYQFPAPNIFYGEPSFWQAELVLVLVMQS